MPALFQQEVAISIHSLLAEGDPRDARAAFAAAISIHSLLAEGDGT